MKHEQNLPEEIIDLSAQKNFKDLTKEERELVLQFQSEEEYKQLFVSSQTAHQFFKEDEVPTIPVSVKVKLNASFEQQFPKRRPLLLRRVELWKAAAVFLLLFCGSVFYLKGNKTEATSVLTIHDTVFREKNVETVKRIIDTVIDYKYADTQKGKAKRAVAPIIGEELYTMDTNRIKYATEPEGSMRTLQPADFPKELPNKNGKSLHEDELMKRFEFARI